MYTREELEKVEIPLAEPLFYSIQGEGPNAGKPSLFVRVAGCNFAMDPNLTPCPWCDTPYALAREGDEVERITGAELMRRIKYEEMRWGHDPGGFRVVFTGGEPMVYGEELLSVAVALTTPQHDPFAPRSIDRIRVEFETNGTIGWDVSRFMTVRGTPIPAPWYPRKMVSWVVSPKLHVDVPLSLLSLPFLYFHGESYCLKFVYTGPECVGKINSVVDSTGTKRHQVWVMPECRSQQEHLEKQQEVIDFCMQNGYNYSPRLQVLAWDNQKGV